MTYKLYQVILQDEWNNLGVVGWFENLDDAIEPINKTLKAGWGEQYKLKKGDIKEYPSTFSYCFDTNLGDILTPDGEYDNYINLLVRGFIYYFEDEEAFNAAKEIFINGGEEYNEQENRSDIYIS